MGDPIERRRGGDGRGRREAYLGRFDHTKFLWEYAPEFTRSNDIGYNGIEGNRPLMAIRMDRYHRIRFCVYQSVYKGGEFVFLFFSSSSFFFFVFFIFLKFRICLLAIYMMEERVSSKGIYVHQKSMVLSGTCLYFLRKKFSRKAPRKFTVKRVWVQLSRIWTGFCTSKYNGENSDSRGWSDWTGHVFVLFVLGQHRRESWYCIYNNATL